MAVEVKVKTPTRDFSIILAITFGLVEEIVRKYCKSNGTKELTKGYKYFREINVTNIKGKYTINVHTFVFTQHDVSFFYLIVT